MSPKDLSFSEKVALLKEALQDVMGEEEKLQSDLYLYHWLRANKYDVKKTDKAMRENLKWRQENGIKELANKNLDPALEARHLYFHTKGIGGIPVAMASGAIDFAGILEDVGKKRLLLHVAQLLAKQENLVHEFDKTWTGSVENLPAERSAGGYSIFDMTGYSIKQNLSMKFLQYLAEYAKMLVKYFPATGHVVMLVNVTKLIEVPLQVFKPIVANHLDLEIHGKDEEDVTVVSHVLKPEQLRELQAKAKEMFGAK